MGLCGCSLISEKGHGKDAADDGEAGEEDDEDAMLNGTDVHCVEMCIVIGLLLDDLARPLRILDDDDDDDEWRKEEKHEDEKNEGEEGYKSRKRTRAIRRSARKV